MKNMAATPKPSIRRSTKRPTHVLVLSDQGAAVMDRNGNFTVVDPEQLTELKIKGQLGVVDLGVLTETTYVSMPELTPDEMLAAIQLTPTDYLPSGSRDDAPLSILPTINDENQSAALIAFMPNETLNLLVQRVTQASLGFAGVEPAIVTAILGVQNSNSATVILQTEPFQHVGLLMFGGQIIGRSRMAATPHLEERIDELYSVLTGMMSLLPPTHPHISALVLLGDPETTARMHAQVEQDNNDVTVTILKGEHLARLALQHGLTLPVTTKGEGRLGSPLLPLLLGAAAGLLPFGVISLQNMQITRSMQREQVVVNKQRGEVQEHSALLRRQQVALGIIQEANTILDSRVNWRERLTRITDQLPEDGGRYTVRFRSFNATATPLTPPNTLSGTAETGAEAQSTPAATPNLRPEVRYTFTALTPSRAAATNAITNFEHTFRLNLEEITREGNGNWQFRGQLQEKPEAQ